MSYNNIIDYTGRKIPEMFDNPLDNILIRGCDKSAPILKKLKMTPNMVTTIGLVFGLLCIICLMKEKYVLAVVFYWISYWLDCMDGHFARKYDMETQFGDYYDHLRDLFIFFGVSTMLFIKLKTSTLRTIYVTTISLSLLLMLIHMGCQEKHSSFSENNHCLGKFKSWCPEHLEAIHFSKFFGCGTLHLIQSIFILMMM